MAGGQQVTRTTADYSSDELCTVMATIIGVDPDTVCETVSVVITHVEGGAHKMSIATSAGGSPGEVIATLEHAIAHLRADCPRCAAEMRRARRGRR